MGDNQGEAVASVSRTGVLAAMAAVCLFSVSTATAQGLEGAIGDLQLNATRFVAQAVLSALVLCVTKQLPIVGRKHLGWFSVVCASIGVQNYFFFAAAPLLPAGVMMGLGFVVLLVLAAIYDIISAKKVVLYTVAPLVIASAGIILATQPQFLGFPPDMFDPNVNRVSVCGASNRSQELNRSFRNVSLESGNGTKLAYPTEQKVWGLTGEQRGYLLVVCFALSAFLSNVLMYLRLQDLSVAITSLWSSVISCAISFILMAVLETPQIPTTPGCWGLFMGHNWSVAFASLCAYYAVSRLPPFVYTLLLSQETVVLAILQFTLLKDIQPGHRNWEGILGVVLIIIGNVARPLLQMLLARGTGAGSQEQPLTSEYMELK